jgi:hypothetical protein
VGGEDEGGPSPAIRQGLQQDKIARCVCFVHKRIFVLIHRALPTYSRKQMEGCISQAAGYAGNVARDGVRPRAPDEHLAPNCKYFPYSFKYKF